MLDKVKDYVVGCNIDIDVALDDLGLEPATVTESQLTKAGMHRCLGCDCWFSSKGHVCAECIDIARKVQLG
jgi:hypothetical protein